MASPTFDICGSWRLTACQLVKKTNNISECYDFFGPAPFGISIYTNDGYFTTHISNPHRKLFQIPVHFFGTDKEWLDAGEGFLGYSGRYELIPSADPLTFTLVNHCESSAFPNWTLTKQNRIANVASDLNHVDIDVPLTEAYAIHLAWERLMNSENIATPLGMQIASNSKMNHKPSNLFNFVKGLDDYFKKLKTMDWDRNPAPIQTQHTDNGK